MKKIIVLASAALMFAGIANAQDLMKATELAKQANEALVNDDCETAVNNFNAALAEAQNCTEEAAAELVENCKKGVVIAMYKQANGMIDAGDLAGAIAQLEATGKKAEEFGEDEYVEKTASKVHQLHQAIAGSKIKAAAGEKDPAAKKALFEEAAAQLELVLATEPNNANALMQKGQVMNALGKKDAAIEAFLAAKENGQEANANKQISTIYLKEASANLSAKKYDEAYTAALKSNEYMESANAYKIAGYAAHSSKRFKEAVENLSKYLELSPNAKDAANVKAAIDADKAQIK